jgi:DNA-binding NarL/FixJ family response regulator
VGPDVTGPVRVLLADDQRVVRDGLVLLLGLLPQVEVVGAAADGDEAVERATALRPDVVLMDLRMPRCDGVEATRRLREQQPDIKVIVLTTYADDRSVIEALRAGARGYLTKDAGGAEIQKALLQVVSGQAVIDPAVQHHLVDAIAVAPPPPPAGQADSPATPHPPPHSPSPPAGPLPAGLTPREAEVLGLIAEGLSNAEIAARLVVSEATVKTHINHLLAKIGARDRAQAVSYAYRSGIAWPRR